MDEPVTIRARVGFLGRPTLDGRLITDLAGPSEGVIPVFRVATFGSTPTLVGSAPLLKVDIRPLHPEERREGDWEHVSAIELSAHVYVAEYARRLLAGTLHLRMDMDRILIERQPDLTVMREGRLRRLTITDAAPAWDGVWVREERTT